MAKTLKAPKWSPPTAEIARNYVDDGKGNEVRQLCTASAVRQQIQAVNHLAANTPTVWFCQSHDDVNSAYVPPSTTLNQFWRWWLDDINNNAQRIRYRMVGMHRGQIGAGYSGQSTATVEFDGSSTASVVNGLSNDDETNDRTPPFDFQQWEMVYRRGAASTVDTNMGIGLDEGFDLMGLTAQAEPVTLLETGTHDAVDPAYPPNGSDVYANVWEELQAAFHALRAGALPIVIAWSGINPTAGSTLSDDKRSVRFTSGTAANMLDPTVTPASWSATSPGFCVPTYLAGVGDPDLGTNDEISVETWVYAKAVGGTGTVSFYGPNGTVNTNSSITTLGWKQCTGDLALKTTSTDDDTTNQRSKIDVLGSVSAGTLYVYGVFAWLKYG